VHVQIKRAHDRLVEDFEHVQVANDDEQILRRLGPLVAPTRGEIDDDFLEDSRTDLRWDGCVQLGSAVVHDNSAQAARGGSCALLCSAGHGHGARMRVGGTDHRSDLLVENADQTRKPECSGSAAAQSIAVTAHTQRSQPLPPLPWEAAARKRLTLPSPPLPSQRWQRTHTRSEHTNGQALGAASPSVAQRRLQ
jgi:hypothetical protein